MKARLEKVRRHTAHNRRDAIVRTSHPPVGEGRESVVPFITNSARLCRESHTLGVGDLFNNNPPFVQPSLWYNSI